MSMSQKLKSTLPKDFEFTSENLKLAQQSIKKYRNIQSAVMPLLYLVQKQCHHWIPPSAIAYISKMLNMPPIKVHEIASFYTMYRQQPVGQNIIQVCKSIACWLRGGDDISDACQRHLQIEVGQTTSDQRFTLLEVECLGACINAPVIRLNDQYYENLNTESILGIIDAISLKKTQKYMDS